MIIEIFVAELQRQFPDRAFRIGVHPEPIVVFPADHSEVGDVMIWKDGEGAIVEIGEITHGHFDAYPSTTSEEEVTIEMANDVADFLKALFDDKVLLWTGPGGWSGGWQRRDFAKEPSVFEQGTRYYLWSGPIF